MTREFIDVVDEGLVIITEADVQLMDDLCKDRVNSLMFIGEYLERKHEGEQINIYSSMSGLILSLNIVDRELTVYH